MNNFRLISRFELWALPAIIVLGLVLGLWGIDWGLPSARRVALLGESVNKARVELSSRSARELELRRAQASILAVQPAEETFDLPRQVRRYLLFTDSPDEGATMLALANLRPKQLDFNPRFVSYGGLHIYGSAAVMVLAHLVGFGRIAGDVAHYADAPQDIARLYIAGRLLMVLYNIGIAIVIFLFAREIAAVCDRSKGETVVSDRRCSACGFLAAILWLLTPPSLTFSHIVNPHLPAAFFGSLAAWLAWRAVKLSSPRSWLGAAAASAGAAACAIHTALSFLVLPAVLLMSAADAKAARSFIRPIFVAVLIAIGMFLALNPYFFANLGVLGQEMNRFREFREPLIGGSSLISFLLLSLPHGIGLVGIIVAVCGAVMLWMNTKAARGLVIYLAVALAATSWLAGSDASLPLAVRFATFLLPLMCLLIALVLTARHMAVPRILVGGLIALGSLGSAFVHEASLAEDPRDDAGDYINQHVPAGARVAVPRSPGPYKTPAFDFSRFHLVTDDSSADFVVEVSEKLRPVPPEAFVKAMEFPRSQFKLLTPLSFSGRTVLVYRRGNHQ